MLIIYRAVSNSKKVKNKLFTPHSTMRPPGNIPYVVDNLWEWARPAGYPNRRFAAFASPTIELATEAFGANCSVYKVEFNNNKNEKKICQLIRAEKKQDSKFHHECKMLKKLMIKNLGNDWFSKDIREKGKISALWMPCMRKKDIESVFQNSALLKSMRDEIFNSINYWKDVVLIKNSNEIPDDKGEIFFEYSDGYFLNSI